MQSRSESSLAKDKFDILDNFLSYNEIILKDDKESVNSYEDLYEIMERFLSQADDIINSTNERFTQLEDIDSLVEEIVALLKINASDMACYRQSMFCNQFLDAPYALASFWEQLVRRYQEMNIILPYPIEQALFDFCQIPCEGKLFDDYKETHFFMHEHSFTNPLDVFIQMHKMPPSIKDIRIGVMNVQKLGLSLVTLLKVIPLSVQWINLSRQKLFTNLSLKESYYFLGKLLALPASKRLLLSNNGEDESVVKIIKHFPAKFIEPSVAYCQAYPQIAIHFFEDISPLVQFVDLSDKHLNLLDEETLFKYLSKVPKTVKSICLQGNNFFKNKTISERDAFLTRINQLPNNDSFDLSNNGEMALCRVLLPLLSLIKQSRLNFNIVGLIVSFLPLADRSITKEQSENNHQFFRKSVIKFITHDSNKVLLDCYTRNGGFLGKGCLLYKFKNSEEIMQTMLENSRENPNGASSQALRHFCLI